MNWNTNDVINTGRSAVLLLNQVSHHIRTNFCIFPNWLHHLVGGVGNVHGRVNGYLVGGVDNVHVQCVCVCMIGLLFIMRWPL